ncbi:transposase [Salinisphaera sp. SWV1]|uniref:transposase n=1 Tax=Salinisphaera sp. SWV1 TaxID=3454139 RepID=UPI003F874E6D
MVGNGAPRFPERQRPGVSEHRHQRCWVDETANVLNNKSPKKTQPKAKSARQAIWMAGTRADADTAFDAFIGAYSDKPPNAADGLAKERDALLTFYDFPGAHWQPIRTTNPIESTFAAGVCESPRHAVT